MTPGEISEAARQLVERTCREQGLPTTVEDPAVLAEIGRILATVDRRHASDE